MAISVPFFVTVGVIPQSFISLALCIIAKEKSATTIATCCSVAYIMFLVEVMLMLVVGIIEPRDDLLLFTYGLNYNVVLLAYGVGSILAMFTCVAVMRIRMRNGMSDRKDV